MLPDTKRMRRKLVICRTGKAVLIAALSRHALPETFQQDLSIGNTMGNTRQLQKALNTTMGRTRQLRFNKTFLLETSPWAAHARCRMLRFHKTFL